MKVSSEHLTEFAIRCEKALAGASCVVIGGSLQVGMAVEFLAEAIAVFEEDSCFIHPLSVPIASAAEAGDGVLAGIALAYSRQEPLKYGLQHGFALAGAILKTLATADFLMEDYRELLPKISITALE